MLNENNFKKKSGCFSQNLHTTLEKNTVKREIRPPNTCPLFNVLYGWTNFDFSLFFLNMWSPEDFPEKQEKNPCVFA